ncbi:hypothetical protein [Nocardioides sp. CER19]|uniref:hypothetical protein n=1 Tax=Nocardioides sp. CER19 TaxID=3038538 RepID=UPI00244B5B31|nr:hypothetical protein [Nocardioides sp. CER19]MDH2416236.1 hypothetical protein [Nocardioides sp. CER19]
MGFGLPDGPMRGLLVVALITLVVSAVLGGVLHLVEVGRGLARLGRRLVPRPESPQGLPIERIARNARRVRAELASVSSGTPMARRVALTGAYDDLLIDACRALGVPDTLSGAPGGLERDSERLHVEQELEAAGLRLSV